MGGMRERQLDGTNLKLHKLFENAHAVPTGGSPTTPALPFLVGDRVHYYPGALSGRFVRRREYLLWLASIHLKPCEEWQKVTRNRLTVNYAWPYFERWFLD
jgi:hypothetical protein